MKRFWRGSGDIAGFFLLTPPCPLAIPRDRDAFGLHAVGDELQGAAADCNSAGATHAWFDSRVAHHSLLNPLFFKRNPRKWTTLFWPVVHIGVPDPCRRGANPERDQKYISLVIATETPLTMSWDLAPRLPRGIRTRFPGNKPSHQIAQADALADTFRRRPDVLVPPSIVRLALLFARCRLWSLWDRV